MKLEIRGALLPGSTKFTLQLFHGSVPHSTQTKGAPELLNDSQGHKHKHGRIGYPFCARGGLFCSMTKRRPAKRLVMTLDCGRDFDGFAYMETSQPPCLIQKSPGSRFVSSFGDGRYELNRQ